MGWGGLWHQEFGGVACGEQGWPFGARDGVMPQAALGLCGFKLHQKSKMVSIRQEQLN